MVAFSFQDLVACASAVKWLYDNGFEHVNSAQLQYNDFGQEVRLLGRNLELLVQCASSIERDASSELPPAHVSSTLPKLDISILLEVCGDFKKTIAESKALLRENISYGREKGLTAPLTNILWNNSIKSSVVRFRERIAIHNRKISFVLEPFKIKLIHDTKLSQRHAFQQLSRGQENNTQRIEAKLGRIFVLLGAPDPTIPAALEPLAVPDRLERHFNLTFAKALPYLGEHRDLSLKDGVNGVTYHLEHFTKEGSAVIIGGAVEVNRYLNLMKSVYILKKIKASKEYDQKIARQKDLIWSNYMEDLEDSCRQQLRRFTDDEPEASRLKVPADTDYEMLYQDSYSFYFEDDQRQENDAVPSITLGTNNELLHLPLAPLSTDSRNHAHELGLIRQSDFELELRYIKTPKNGPGSATTFITPVHLHKALIIPLWALSSTTQKWSIRFRGDANIQTEGQFMFVKSQDLYLFQQAILGYKASFDNNGVDVGIRIYDTSGGQKDTRVVGKIMIFQDAKLNTPALPPVDPLYQGSTVSLASSMTPMSPISPMSPLPPISPTSPIHLSPSPALASTRRTSRQESMVSIPSSISTALTSASGATMASFVSTHTSPINAHNGTVRSVQFSNITEPLIVFLIRADESGHARFSLLGIKLDSATVARTGCNSRQCKLMRRCIHATIERPGTGLNALRVDSSSDATWNLAALGRYQQDSPAVEKPKKMHYVHIAFSTPQERDAFLERVKKLKEIWVAKCKKLDLDKANARRVSVIRRHEVDRI